MTLIPNISNKSCFIPCPKSKVDSGQCDCYNRIGNIELEKLQKKTEEETKDINHYLEVKIVTSGVLGYSDILEIIKQYQGNDYEFDGTIQTDNNVYWAFVRKNNGLNII